MVRKIAVFESDVAPTTLRAMALDQHELSTRINALRDQLKLLADSL